MEFIGFVFFKQPFIIYYTYKVRYHIMPATSI